MRPFRILLVVLTLFTVVLARPRPVTDGTQFLPSTGFTAFQYDDGTTLAVDTEYDEYRVFLDFYDSLGEWVYTDCLKENAWEDLVGQWRYYSDLEAYAIYDRHGSVYLRFPKEMQERVSYRSTVVMDFTAQAPYTGNELIVGGGILKSRVRWRGTEVIDSPELGSVLAYRVEIQERLKGTLFGYPVKTRDRHIEWFVPGYGPVMYANRNGVWTVIGTEDL